MSLAALKEAIDELVATDGSVLGEADAVVELQRQLSRLDAVATKAVGAFDTSGRWADDQARNASCWVATRCRLPRAQARRVVRRARVLRHLPEFDAAYAQGSVTPWHLDLVLGVRRPGSEEALNRDEWLLVKKATRLRFEQFARVLSYWDQLADPDGTEAAAQERLERRDAYLVASLDGMYLGKMNLDPISGAIVATELERLERIYFEADWHEATERLGCAPKVADLIRTPAQRRADALVEMATRSATMPENGRRPLPLFSVLVGWETFAGRLCELARGQVLTPGSLVRWLDQTEVERAIFEPGGRVEVSATARFFTGGIRRAIELRDQQCTHPMCDEPAERCQCDHIVPYSEGGLTVQENGRLLCPFHNRLRNQRPEPGD